MVLHYLQPGIEITLIVALSALFTEGLLWAWAFRHSSYRSLKAQVEKQSRKLEALKNAPQSYSKQKTKGRKVDRLENYLKMDVAKSLASIRLKQMAVMACTLFLLFRSLSTWYYGESVAKLPFEPPALLRKLSQRGIESGLANDCSFAFLYAVLNAGLRPNITKLLDFGPSRKMLALSTFQNPIDKQQ